MSTVQQIFVNLPVKDLDKSKKFFSHLGFKFNPQFTDENAACVIIGENIFAMLLLEKFFKGFTKKQIIDSSKNIEVITALQVNSKKEVDEMVHKALEAGGKKSNDPFDHGWMYGWSFQDPDGHMWEVFYGDITKFKKD
ncbi:VOC family protein [Candidatus Pacearchaeota archaeon]|nr:VOC family protein [Candidatus Pacearchaeota archaeon]